MPKVCEEALERISSKERVLKGVDSFNNMWIKWEIPKHTKKTQHVLVQLLTAKQQEQSSMQKILTQ